jgi:hypothetical protein
LTILKSALTKITCNDKNNSAPQGSESNLSPGDVLARHPANFFLGEMMEHENE